MCKIYFKNIYPISIYPRVYFHLCKFATQCVPRRCLPAVGRLIPGAAPVLYHAALSQVSDIINHSLLSTSAATTKP